MEYSSIPLAHTVVTLCKAYGIKQVVISPGSRNAPLVIGFTSDPYFECFSIVDERSAAFFAMGLSQQSGVPSALVCTSGSAMLNYYPAVAEAYYSRIPFVVLSADRPPYKIDIGDGQTIRQDGVYDRHIGFSAQLQQDPGHATARIRWQPGSKPESAGALRELARERQAFNEAQIGKALTVASREKWPVHVNIPFEEPLYDTVKKQPCQPGRPDSPVRSKRSVPWETIARDWEQAKKIMILAGTLPPDAMAEAQLEALGGDASVIVFTETTSNLQHPEFFPSIDTIMAPLELQQDAESEFRRLRPDLLITIGGMIVSKKIKKFLRDYPPQQHWHVDPLQANDTFYSLKRHIRLPVNEFFETLFKRTARRSESKYRTSWSKIREQFRLGRRNYLKQIPFSDFKAFDCVFRGLPDHLTVQLANSSTVRYAQLFDRKPGQRTFCNRGTSGIEGSTSTAVGASQNAPCPTVLISGDLSFLYDSNGLWNGYLRKDFRVIVINNSGGGIFRILPGFREDPKFATYFETVHQQNLGPLCEMHGLTYVKADTLKGLKQALSSFFEPSGRPALLEVQTPREANDKVLLEYFQFLSSKPT